MKIKVIIAVVCILFFLESCITKIESIDNKGNVIIRIEKEERSDKNLALTLHPNTDYIIVTLNNKEDGRVFEGRSENTSSSFEIKISDVPYGNYKLSIISYDPNNIVLARIEDDYIVGDEIIAYEGVFGKPKNFNENPIEPITGSNITNELVLSLYSIKSNYENDPTYDTIDYSIYIGLNSQLSDFDKINIPKSSTAENTLIEYFESDFLEYNFTFELDKKYYWKIIGTNSIGSVESNTWSFIYNNKIGRLSSFDESNFFPVNQVVNPIDFEVFTFEIFSIAAIEDGGNNNYNLVTYNISIWQDPANLLPEPPRLTSDSANQLMQFNYDLYSLPTGTYYWKVTGTNGYNTVESSVFSFEVLNPQPIAGF